MDAATANPAPVLFVALMLGRELGTALAATTLASLGGAAAAERYRLPRPAGLHLTLFYVGALSTARVADLAAALDAALAGATAPVLGLAESGAFPAPGRERVLWVGVDELGGSTLAELRGRVLAGAASVEIDVASAGRHSFHPHITVARPRRAGVPSRFYELVQGASWTPREVALVESVRGTGAAVYRPIARFPLAG